MDNPEHKQILEDAVRLFLKLEANPDDDALQAELDTFLARGDAERTAYKKTVAGWKATGVKPPNTKLGLVAAVVAIGLGALYGADPLRTALLADLSTGLETSQNTLKSGDIVFLDAGSAVVDETNPEKEDRSVTVLHGAAYFDVAQDGRRFHVTLGDVTVEAIGTAFETAFVDDAISIEVSEGIVRATSPDQTWHLNAGDTLLWSKERGAQVSEIETDLVAAWRGDQLIVQNMAIEQVVDILDRRIRGDVVLVGRSFANKTVSGSFDLSDPLGALNVLAATQNARIVPGRPFATLLIPRQ